MYVFIYLYIYLAVGLSCGTQGLVPLTRDGTPALSIGSVES